MWLYNCALKKVTNDSAEEAVGCCAHMPLLEAENISMKEKHGGLYGAQRITSLYLAKPHKPPPAHKHCLQHIVQGTPPPRTHRDRTSSGSNWAARKPTAFCLKKDN